MKMKTEALLALFLAAGCSPPATHPVPRAEVAEAEPRDPDAGAPLESRTAPHPGASSKPKEVEVPPNVRTVKGVRVAGRSINDVSQAEMAEAIHRAGYEAILDPPQPCGTLQHLTVGFMRGKASGMVGLFRIEEPSADEQCTGSHPAEYLDAWRAAAEANDSTSVLIYDEEGEALLAINALGGDLAMAREIAAALLD